MWNKKQRLLHVRFWGRAYLVPAEEAEGPGREESERQEPNGSFQKLREGGSEQLSQIPT